jgi:hypothetical protein
MERKPKIVFGSTSNFVEIYLVWKLVITTFMKPNFISIKKTYQIFE